MVGDVAVDEISDWRARHFDWYLIKKLFIEERDLLELKILQTELLDDVAKAALVVAVDQFLTLPMAEQEVSRYSLHRPNRDHFVFADEPESLRITAILTFSFQVEERSVDIEALMAFLDDVQNTARAVKIKRCRLSQQPSESIAA